MQLMSSKVDAESFSTMGQSEVARWLIKLLTLFLWLSCVFVFEFDLVVCVGQDPAPLIAAERKKKKRIQLNTWNNPNRGTN